MKSIWRALAICLVLAALIVLPVSAKDTGYCIDATPAITEATYEYLNEIYLEKFPELALEYSFGSEKDKNTLKKLADSITAGATSDKQKVNAIVNWVSENIEYVSYTSGEAEYFAIDTYYAKKGNCLGISQLIVQLCRLSSIKAVMCCGTRGDMRDFVSLESREMDHAWAMIYHNGNWRLYDPLFSVRGETDKTVISRWYFTDFIEGVSPYVKEYVKYICNGKSIFYIDGRFLYCVEGIPASEFYKMAAEGGMSLNGAVPYFTKNYYNNKYNTGGDGFNYLEEPSRKDTMINDECYSDGWLTYGASMYYAKPNGILAGSTMKEYNGKCYYLPFGSSAIVFPGSSNDYTFTRGFPTLIKGTKFSVELPWAEEEVNKWGKVIAWKTETPETVSVTADGKITALAEGYACISACSKDSYEDDTHYLFSYIEFWVSKGERTVSYKTDVSKLNVSLSKTTYTYNGKVKTPEVTVKTGAGKVLKKGTDYTVSYAKGRKNAGTYEVTVKMKGNYTGTKVLTFKIKPIDISDCKIKLAKTSYTYNGKTKSPSVTVKSAGGKSLKKGTHYTVTYAKGRKNVGTYKVTVKMKGNYTGTKVLTFKITPPKTVLKKVTPKNDALKISIDKETKQVTGYQVQYSASKTFKKATTKTVKSYKTTSLTLKNLKSGTKYFVRVRTFKTVNGTKIYSGWSTSKTARTK